MTMLSSQQLSVDQPGYTSGRGHRKPWRRQLTPYLYIAPAFAVVGVVLIYPMVLNLSYSFYEFRFTDPDAATFVGLENYRSLFSDSQFRQAYGFTALFTVGTLAAEFVIALGSALLLVTLRKGRQAATTIVTLPYMLAAIAVGLLWRLLWASNYGLVNALLGWLGIDGLTWLAEKWTAIFAVMVAEVWRSTPFVTLILLAGLVSIPRDVLEASRVDGVTALQQLWYVKLPLLMPAAVVALLFQTVFKLRVFDLIFILTSGGPGTETVPVGILIYRTYFRYLSGGAAATAAVALLVTGLVISVVYIKVLDRFSEV